MSHTFDIRFARSQGLTAFFEAPANPFRWKGQGKLSIDDGGVSIVVKRGLTSLFSRRRSHRIAADTLTEVYREGEALRLEFGTQADRRVLPVWAEGSEAAARIVKLLPTTHTVELEHATQPPRRFQLHKRMAILVSIPLIAIAVLLLVNARSPVDRDSLAATDVSVTAIPVHVPVATPVATPEAPAVEPDIAQRRQDLFESELKELRNVYFNLLGRDASLAPERLEPRWWEVRFRLDTAEPTSGPAFTGYREAQLAVVGSWNSAVSLLAAGLRLHDERLVELAQKQRELAEQQEHILRQYVH